MKYFLFLPLVFGCNFTIPSEIKNPSNIDKCKAEIKRYEKLLTYPPRFSYNYGICEIEPTLEQCACHEIDPLPLNCTETQIKMYENIERLKKEISDTKDIIKKARDRQGKKLLIEINQIEKKRLIEIEKNRSSYKKRCDELEGNSK